MIHKFLKILFAKKYLIKEDNHLWISVYDSMPQLKVEWEGQSKCFWRSRFVIVKLINGDEIKACRYQNMWCNRFGITECALPRFKVKWWRDITDEEKNKPNDEFKDHCDWNKSFYGY